MARPRQDLATRLARVEPVAVDGVVNSKHVTRGDREALLREGWLTPVCRGWYLLHAPGGGDGDSVAWFGSIWSFVRVYLTKRFGGGWCLSAEGSLAIHAGNSSVPRQVVAITATGGAMSLDLPHSTSLLVYPDPRRLPTTVDVLDGIRVMKLPEALLRVAPVFFRTRGADAAIAMRMVSSPLDVARTALEEGPIDAIGRLVGGWRALGEDSAAASVRAALEGSGHSFVESNPFDSAPPRLRTRPRSAYAGRVAELWARMREPVARMWPEPPEAVSAESYLREVDQRAPGDAWHSLSIEGYRVTPELIDAVRRGDGLGKSNEQGDALAALGYLRAHHAVRESIADILGGASAATVSQRDLDSWHQSMFSSQVDAGLLMRSQLLGYRRQPVYIRGSRHVPPPYGAVADAMIELFDQLRGEALASVRAVLGHFVFTWIHPYGDGNGRLGRFLMNVQLSSGGYPWTVVRMERRGAYMASLEAASVDGDIRQFAELLKEEMESNS